MSRAHAPDQVGSRAVSFSVKSEREKSFVQSSVAISRDVFQYVVYKNLP